MSAMPNITWKGVVVIGFFGLSIPGATIYRESMLRFLSELLGILSENAKVVLALIGL